MPTGIYDGMRIVNFTLTAAIWLFGIRLLFMFKNLNPDLLKARLFLKIESVKKMWLYSLGAGGFFVLHKVIDVLEYLRHLEIGGLYEVTNTLFIIFFLLLTYEWIAFLK